jgi:predicted enzyme related to lactoylglutathione lyase
MSFTPANSVVWMEIPVRDIDRGMAFYNSVFGYDLKRSEDFPNPMAIFPTATPNSVSGHIYEGEPARPGEGPTIHLAVSDTLEATAERCEKAGGTIKSDPIPLPVGRFQYALDPDGNSIGLFEVKAA